MFPSACVLQAPLQSSLLPEVFLCSRELLSSQVSPGIPACPTVDTLSAGTMQYLGKPRTGSLWRPARLSMVDLGGVGCETDSDLTFNPCLPQKKPVILWEDTLACPEFVKPTMSLDVSSNWLCTSFLLILRYYEDQAPKKKAPQIEYFCSSLLCVTGNGQGGLCKGGAPGPERLVGAVEERMFPPVCSSLWCEPELPFPMAHNGLLPFPSAPKECGEGLKTTTLGSAVLGKSRQLPSVSSGVGFKKPARESFSWLCFPKPLHPLPTHPVKLPFLCLQLVCRCCPTDGSHQPGRLHLPGDIREDSAAAALSQPDPSCRGRGGRSHRAGGGVRLGAEPSSCTPHSSCPAG